MARSLDIFDLLGRLDSSKGIVLTEEQWKEFAPYVVQRWKSGTGDPLQVVLLNEVVNPYVFSLPTHKPMLLSLLQSTTTGPKRYGWLGLKGAEKFPNKRKVLQEYYGYSNREISSLTVWPSDDEVMEMAQSLGWQKDDVAALKKELNGPSKKSK